MTGASFEGARALFTGRGPACLSPKNPVRQRRAGVKGQNGRGHKTARALLHCLPAPCSNRKSIRTRGARSGGWLAAKHERQPSKKVSQLFGAAFGIFWGTRTRCLEAFSSGRLCLFDAWVACPHFVVCGPGGGRGGGGAVCKRTRAGESGDKQGWGLTKSLIWNERRAEREKGGAGSERVNDRHFFACGSRVRR